MSSQPLFFAPLRVPLVDARTGLMSREWYLFFQGMYQRVGGVSAPSNDDLAQGQADDAGIEEIKAMLFGSQDALAQTPTIFASPVPDSALDQLAEMREILAEQAKQIQALQQSVSL